MKRLRSVIEGLVSGLNCRKISIRHKISITPQYAIGETNGEPWIKCLTCGMTSYNHYDIKYLFCGGCHRFHHGLY